MADQRTTDLDPIATIPDSAVFDVVDTTNTTQDPAGSSFKITKANLLKEATAAILLNTAKIGVTTGQAAAILLNTEKVGITTDQAAAILLNTAKVGITVSQAAAILLNTAKTGITTTQATAIIDNTAKVGITTGQAAAILLNTAKVGITTDQAAAILLNTAKVGITTSQAAAILLNTAKVGITTAQSAAIALNSTDVSIAKLSNGLQFSQTTTQRIIKLGTFEAGNFLRLEVSNASIITTGAFNFQVFQIGGVGILGILYANGIVDASVAQTGEIWVVVNITGTITSAKYDLKLTSSINAVADRNIKSIVKFQPKEDYGYDFNTTGYTAHPTLALFSYQNANTNKEGVLQKILLNVAVSGTFTFAIGTLDQRPWAIISKEFNVFTNVTGRQTFDVSDKFLTMGVNEYLFVYTKKNGTETINTKNYTAATSNPNFIFGSPDGQILPNSSTFGGGIVFSWDVIPLDSYFASNKSLDLITTQVSNVSTIANSAFNSIAKVSDSAGNVYKMVVVNGAISLQALNFQRVMVVGNSLLTGLAGRGLACTVPSNDFASKLLLGVQAKYATATMTKISAAGWERDLSTSASTFNTLFSSASGVYDLIVIRLGENVNNISSFQSGIEGMIDYLRASYPLATFLVTSTVLDFSNSAKNTALSNAASNKSASYVAINGSTDNFRIGTSRMYTNASNVIAPSDFTILTHSNDLGFLFTANEMLNAVGYNKLNNSFALNVTANVTADFPAYGVTNGIVTIKTYGASAPTISVNSGAISVTHYQLSTFTYDNRLISGVADTATYSSTFIMPASAVTVTVN